MFDMEWEFDLELAIDGGDYAALAGKAALREDPGYGFVVIGISLYGNRRNKARDRCETPLYPRHPDPFSRALFRKLEEQILGDPQAQEDFAEAHAEALFECAA